MKYSTHMIALSFLMIPSMSYAGFDWGGSGGSCSGSGDFEQQILDKAIINVGEIPSGKKDVYIKLISNKDVDVQLYDKSTGDKIVHWPYGILKGAGKESTNYKGVSIEWSGYNGDGTGKGHEYIKISGTTNRTLVMKAYGYQSGFANVDYSWTGTQDCTEGGGTSESGSGTFQQQILNNAIVTVGDIPIGINNLSIQLKSSKDVDIQLYDKDDGTKIIVWPDGILKGAGKQTTNYQGMSLEWSGFDGDGTGKGHEYIKISGKTRRNLTMKAYGYQTGYAEVNYKWGNEVIPLCKKQAKNYSSNQNNVCQVSKRLEVEALDQENYSFVINGNNYGVGGCVPTTYAMMFNYATKSAGYTPVSASSTIEKLLNIYAIDGVLEPYDPETGTGVDVQDKAFINNLLHSNITYKSCNSSIGYGVNIKRENTSSNMTLYTFMEKVRLNIDKNKSIGISVMVFGKKYLTWNDYKYRGGHHMLLTGYNGSDILYANDTWGTSYSTWTHIDINDYDFYNEDDDFVDTTRIHDSPVLSGHLAFTNGNGKIIFLKTHNASFNTPISVTPYDYVGGCLAKLSPLTFSSMLINSL